MTAFYNENDPKAAAWLRELIKAGLIAPGIVDERSIEDIKPDELTQYTQCHFFAGIGGWSYALRLAGWPDDRPVWTGSCPCQPFSAAGKRAGFADERHLWPAWHWLIEQCRPERIFGEQVASTLAWLDLVSTDLEAQGYAVGAAVLGAHSVGAPHIRQRLYWVADAEYIPCTNGGELGDPSSHGRVEWRPDSDGGRAIGASVVGDADFPRSQGRSKRGDGTNKRVAWPPGMAVEWINCTDGKARSTQPGLFPLAHGLPGRVGLLRGYGNAIVPQCAQAFIMSAVESKP